MGSEDITFSPLTILVAVALAVITIALPHIAKSIKKSKDSPLKVASLIQIARVIFLMSLILVLAIALTGVHSDKLSFIIQILTFSIFYIITVTALQGMISGTITLRTGVSSGVNLKGYKARIVSLIFLMFMFALCFLSIIVVLSK